MINSSTTPQERADALNESLKSKAQLILDQIKIDSDKIKQDIADADERKKIKEADIALEQKGIKDKMDAIALQITTETQTMITEDVKRRKLESEYTTFF